eukprot:2823768-Lingulodinium_polyedra.AAC.1
MTLRRHQGQVTAKRSLGSAQDAPCGDSRWSDSLRNGVGTTERYNAGSISSLSSCVAFFFLLDFGRDAPVRA